MNSIKILAISGSLRANSSNSAIIKAISNFAPKNVAIEFYENLGKLPFFSPELDSEIPPEIIQDFRKSIANANAVIFSTPEYAYGVPGVLKNALDWLVSTTVFDQKPTLVITAAASGAKAHESLCLTLTTIGAKVTHETQLLIPHVRTKISSSGEITDSETLIALTNAFNAFMNLI